MMILLAVNIWSFSVMRKCGHVEKAYAWGHFIDIFPHETNVFLQYTLKRSSIWVNSSGQEKLGARSCRVSAVHLK